jgi:D-alanyl-lipoteichoic acid acyltransferase DltB (MBOAT superfamily)
VLFPTFSFIFGFLPITLTVFFLLYRKSNKHAVAILLVTSLIFYILPNWLHAHVIISSIIVNFFISKYIQSSIKHSKKLLALGVIYNLCVIIYFKYSFFFGEMFTIVSGLDLGLTKYVLPVGISFYTFQQIAYLVDCYKDKNVDYNFWQYALFITFFPQLIAGPIVHHKELMPQISLLGKQKIQADVFFAGLCIFIFGLAKKLLLADNLENYATEIFVLADSGVAISTASAWLGSLSYTLQLYFDFSAYSDMAIGLGLLFGIKLPINFFSPYKSESITEFWRRWHITLSSFLRDYLYIPLGGNRTGNRHVNLLLTMLLGGLWHGAGVNFIIWGGLHGVYLVINHAFKEVCRNFGLAMPYFLGVMITMTSVVIAWVFFRAETLDGALSLISSMFSYNIVNDGVKITNASICLIIIGFIVTQFLPNVAQLFDYNGLKTVESWQPLQRFSIVCKGQLFSVLVIVALLVGALMFMAQPTVFIYFNF